MIRSILHLSVLITLGFFISCKTESSPETSKTANEISECPANLNWDKVLEGQVIVRNNDTYLGITWNIEKILPAGQDVLPKHMIICAVPELLQRTSSPDEKLPDAVRIDAVITRSKDRLGAPNWEDAKKYARVKVQRSSLARLKNPVGSKPDEIRMILEKFEIL